MDASRTTNNNSTSPRAAHGDAIAPAAALPIEQGNSFPSPILYKDSPTGFSNFQTSNTARVSFGPTDTRPIPPRDCLLGPTAATPPAAAAPPATAADDPTATAAIAAAAPATNGLSQPAFDHDEGDMVQTAEQAEHAAASAATPPPTPPSRTHK